MGPVELAIRDRDFRESIFEDLELLAIPDDFEIREKDLDAAELSVQSRIFARGSDYNEELYRQPRPNLAQAISRIVCGPAKVLSHFAHYYS